MATVSYACTELPANLKPCTLEAWASKTQGIIPHQSLHEKECNHHHSAHNASSYDQNQRNQKDQLTQPLPNPRTRVNHIPSEVCRSFSV